MGMNVLDKQGAREYKTRVFTEKGYETLETYTGELIKWYNDKNTIFPFKQGLVLGLPQMLFAQIIPSKEALLERIKAYMMVLGVKELRLKKGETAEEVFKIEVKEDDS